MAKKVKSMIKLQVPAAKATPAPPIGPALGQHGVNIPGFCKEFNERTAKEAGMIIPVVITVYTDNTFTFITHKTPSLPCAIVPAFLCLFLRGEQPIHVGCDITCHVPHDARLGSEFPCIHRGVAFR